MNNKLRALFTILFFVTMAVFDAKPQVPQTSPGCEASGYFEGMASSRQAGDLSVALNLACKEGSYSGQFITPVGKFEVISARLNGGKFAMKFSSGSDSGTLNADLASGELKGQFTFGDDSGPVALKRIGEARAAGYDKPTLQLTPSQWREDLQFFATEVPRQHANAFYHLSRQDFDQMVARADQMMKHADGDEAYIAVDQIANAIGDGHTFVMWPDNVGHVPLDIGLFDGVYRVAGVTSGDERALGASIVKIGDMPLEEVVRRLRTITPAAETKMLGDIRMEDFLCIGMLLHGLGIIPDDKSIRYTLADETGKQFALALQALPMDQVMTMRWVRPFSRRPLYLERRNSDLWCQYLDTPSTLYCKFTGYDNLAQNALQLLDEIKQRHPKKVAIDMRYNLGGDYTLGEKYLIQPLRALKDVNLRGHLFVLISPYTFSAGMSNAAQFRSETNAILVGETVGERPNSFQEARELRLPNSHLVVRISTKYYKFSDSKENVLAPDKEIPRTWQGYKAGRDAVMDWVEKQ